MRTILLLLGLVLLPALALGQDAKPAARDSEPTPAEKAFRALNEKRTLDLRDQPLEQVVEALTEVTGVPFEVDAGAIGVGFGLNPPGTQTVTLRGDKVPVGDALSQALAPYSLTWIVLNGRVMITSTDRASWLQFQQRVTANVSDVPLSKALDQLSRRHGITITVDPQTGKQAETPVSMRMQTANLEAVVHVLASNAGLQAVRLDNVLYVTTPEKAKLMPPMLTPAISSVSPLLYPYNQFGPFALMGGFGVGGGAAGFGGNPGQQGGATNFGFTGALGAFGFAGGAPPAVPKRGAGSKSSFLPRHPALRLVMAAPVPEKPKTPGEETPAMRIRRELNAAVSIDLQGIPLTQAVLRLKEKTGIDVVLDRPLLDNHFAAFNENGIEGVTVSAKLDKVPVRQGLRKVLNGLDLSFVILGDQVLITTHSMVAVRQMRQPVSIDLDKAAAGDALTKLARDHAVNLVLDSRATKESQEKVSLQLDDVTLHTAMKLLAEQAGLKAVLVDNVVYVTTKARAAEMREDPDLRPPPTPWDGNFPFPAGPGGVLPFAPMGIPGGAGGAAPGNGEAPPPPDGMR